MELIKLQRQFDFSVEKINLLEQSKNRKASIAAYTIGIIGTVFMALSVFAVTANMLLLCVILAIPAFIGWILPYFCYRFMSAKRENQIAPMIEEKYNEIYEVCEKANYLIHSNI